ncbi:unnamed protein product [Trifolium pratense]|uniref:Uncharacterized protein n=1 Tax=Trifolium pratense TaxID=57577 RepID=A0ACB0L4E2_TRIPR|nr:unnamed protein product [Trifolium pratense]
MNHCFELLDPNYIDPLVGYLVKCGAYEADRSEVEDSGTPSVGPESMKVLNAYTYPWLTSTLSLARGSLMMLISWATRIAEAPKTDLEFWKTLFPVVIAHIIGHVAATVSMSKVAVSFTHIINSGESAFSVLVSRFILGETFLVPVYLSLLPIIGGCALAAVTELNFNMIGNELDSLRIFCFCFYIVRHNTDYNCELNLKKVSLCLIT